MKGLQVLLALFVEGLRTEEINESFHRLKVLYMLYFASAML